MTPSMRLLTVIGLVAAVSPLLLRAEIVAAPSCNSIFSTLAPCLDFVKGDANKPPTDCCMGAEAIMKQARSKQNREAICKCLKEGLITIGPYDPNRITLIGKQCGIQMTIPPISNATKCDSWVIV